MASVTGTKTELKSGEKQTAQRHDQRVENSTDEYLGQNNAKRGEYDPQNPHHNFDPIAAENAAHALEVGNAAYSADPPKEADKRDYLKEGNKVKKSDLVEVKLLKDFGPGPGAIFEVANSDQVNAPHNNGKVKAGTNIRLPREMAERFIKLGSAEAITK